MASLNLHIDKELNPDGTYSVLAKVTSADVIEADIFVYSQGSKAYSHVASLWDMKTWPNTDTPGQPWYRKKVVGFEFGPDTPELAAKAVATLKSSVNLLLREFNSLGSSFPGVEDITIPTAPTAPVILTQPKDVVAHVGDNVTFKVEVDRSVQQPGWTLSYQWWEASQRTGNIPAAIAGETKDTLLFNAQTYHANAARAGADPKFGWYWCVVKNTDANFAASTTTTTQASLQVD